MTLALLAVASVILVGLAVTTLLVHLAALRLERTNPTLLKSVGILQVDWLFRFNRGIWRLAFSPTAIALSKNDRLLMRSYWIFFLLFPVAVIFVKLSGR